MMPSSYENRRVNFDIIVRKYIEYLRLYKAINHGDLKGITTFDQFYLRYTYYSKYSDPKHSVRSGY